MKAVKDTDTILKELGLTPMERRCYLYLLDEDHMPASQVAQGLGISRTQVYPTLQKLGASGFIYTFKVGQSATFYSAYHPKEAVERYILYVRQLTLPLITQGS